MENLTKNTLNIINEDKDALDKFIMNERTNENYITKAYSYARKKQIYLNLYNIIKFVLKSYLITYLLTSHGQLVIFKVSDDDYIPKFFLSVFPKDLNTKDEEIYYINASIDTIYSINGTLDTSINKYYNHRRCDIDINYEKLNCDKDCENILKDFQNNTHYKICYNNIEYHIFNDMLVYTLPILLMEIFVSFFNIDYFVWVFLKKEIATNRVNISKNFDINKYININKYLDYKLKRNKITIKIALFLNMLIINFIWSDIINYTLNNYKDNNFIYNNYILIDKGHHYRGTLSDNIAFNLPNILIWIIMIMNSWVGYIIMPIVLFAKIIFSFSNIFKVFTIGFLRPNLFISSLNIFNQTAYFKPLFWFYFELFINPFISDIFVLNIDIVNINNLKNNIIKKNIMSMLILNYQILIII